MSTDAEVWNPAMAVSYSSLTLHRQCPQAWSYRYLRGLDSVESGVARSFGSWWHLVRAMDSLRRGIDGGMLKAAPATLSTGDGGPTLTRVGAALGDPQPAYGARYRLPGGQTVPVSAEAAIAVSAAYWRTLSGDEKDAWTEALGEPLPDRLAYMNDRYVERWRDDLATEAPLAVEFKFGRAVPNGSGAMITGYVDEVYLDTKRNLVVVRDHKSGKSLPSAESSDDLSDSQLHLYGWGVAPDVDGWGHGPVAALSYDRARTAKPSQPALTLAGALSKSTTDYDRRTYEEFASGGVPWGVEGEHYKTGKKAGEPKFGTYELDPAVIERLSTPDALSVWHQRTLTPLNRNVIAAHLQSVADTQEQAARTVEQHATTRRAPRNFTRRGCGWCDFRKLCQAELIGGPDGEYPPEQFGLIHHNR